MTRAKMMNRLVLSLNWLVWDWIESVNSLTLSTASVSQLPKPHPHLPALGQQQGLTGQQTTFDTKHQANNVLHLFLIHVCKQMPLSCLIIHFPIGPERDKETTESDDVQCTKINDEYRPNKQYFKTIQRNRFFGYSIFISHRQTSSPHLRSCPLYMPPNTTIQMTKAMTTNVPKTSFLVIFVPTNIFANIKLNIKATLPKGATHCVFR